MTSVERVIEYTELESEAPWQTPKRPPPDWPSKGLVTFDRVSFSYNDYSPPVLHSLKAMFLPQEKVGLSSCSVAYGRLRSSADNCSPSDWYRGSHRRWEEFADLCPVPIGRASGKDLHRWRSDIWNWPPRPAQEHVHHTSGAPKLTPILFS